MEQYIFGKKRGIRVERLVYKRGENTMVARLTSPLLLSPDELEEAKSMLSTGGAALRIECDCGDRVSLAASHDPLLYTRITELWSDIFPASRPALINAVYSSDGGHITVRVPKELYGVCAVKEGCARLNEHLKDIYGLDDLVCACADGDIAAPVPEAKPREIRIDKPKKQVPDLGIVLMGNAIKRADIIRMADVNEESGTVTIAGTVFSIDRRDRKDGGIIGVFNLTDKTNTLPCKVFLDATELKLWDKIEECYKKGDTLTVRGQCTRDDFMRELCVFPRVIMAKPTVRRTDNAEKKRVELHLHTQMSAMDAMGEAKACVKLAKSFGHTAMAVTDHGVVQAFPAAVNAAGKDLKILMGVEGYLLPDSTLLPQTTPLCCLGIMETGGEKSEIYQIGAFKPDTGERYSSYICPEASLSKTQLDMIGISGETLASAPPLWQAIDGLLTFCGSRTFVTFDKERFMRLAPSVQLQSEADTHTGSVPLSVLSHYVDRKADVTSLETALKDICFETYPDTHDAASRAEAIARLLAKLIPMVRDMGADTLPLFSGLPREKKKGRRQSFHIILLAADHEGLMNLYRLVSYAHIEHYKTVPLIPRSLLSMHRKGLIVGSACEAGELFRAILERAPEEEIIKTASFYDYLEIQPIGNNAFLVRDGIVENDEGLRDLNREIVKLGDSLHIPVCATGDVHFLQPEDAVFRAILMHSRDFKDAEQQAPLYFKTTEEMLEEFSYLGDEKAFEVVVANTNMIADRIETMPPFLSEKRTYAPTFDGADDELRDTAVARAHEIYGDVLPEPVQKRLDRELTSIIGNGYASLYLMARRLVKKTNEDGYLVGSRGSVGSSLVAMLAGITEINALPAHYICPKCKHSDFTPDRKIYCTGVDLPDAVCPVCGTPYTKAGYDIYFEVFLGFKGDKTPDIDLNFSGVSQSNAHKYVEFMFGSDHAYRAGTISGVKEKTAYGYVKSYCADNNMVVTRAETDRLVAGCSGVKRTTGQHPGGIVIVPKDRDIMEFTPIQYPADKQEATITTHFDFHALDDRLVKLDILGHDDPTTLKMLGDLTGMPPTAIPLDDKATMSIFSSTGALGITLDELDCSVGSIAVPEFGTTFVRQMLKDTLPTTMEELVRIAGLAHGTDVWLGNAQELIRAGVANLREVICARDDIMDYLIKQGGDPALSFKTMESVRKGKGLSPDMEKAMLAVGTPQWLIDSCKKIKYLFPRAHAAAYVMMSFRVAYYKVHYPAAFYAAYFTVRADAFDVEKAIGGEAAVLRNINTLRKKGQEISDKEFDLLTILEVVYEMNKRGIALLPVDLEKSTDMEFLIEDGNIRPPYNAIAGVGENAAKAIYEAAKAAPFSSAEDIRVRGKANTGVVAKLREMGVLDGLPETNQLTLF